MGSLRTDVEGSGGGGGGGGGRVRCEEAGREQDDDGRTESR